MAFLILSAISEILEPEIYMQTDIICIENTLPESLILIAKGEVQLLPTGLNHRQVWKHSTEDRVQWERRGPNYR